MTKGGFIMLKSREEFEARGCGGFVKKAVEFIKNEARRKGLKKIIVGLDGSVWTTILAAMAVRTGMQVSALTIYAEELIPKGHLDQAERVARHLNISQEILDVRGVSQAMKNIKPDNSETLIGYINSITKEIVSESGALLIGAGSSAKTAFGSTLSFHSLTINQVKELAKFLGAYKPDKSENEDVREDDKSLSEKWVVEETGEGYGIAQSYG